MYKLRKIQKSCLQKAAFAVKYMSEESLRKGAERPEKCGRCAQIKKRSIYMKKILLKMSGEALGNGTGDIYDPAFVDGVAAALRDCAAEGYQIALVVGAGNIWRGRRGVEMNHVTADHMGMLATVINSLCLKDAIIRLGGRARVMSAVSMMPFAEDYSAEKACGYMSEGDVVILGAGLGVPFMSTDTAGAVRAAEIGADTMLMAKNIDYIYTDDPRKNPGAERLERISCSELLSRGLTAIDATAAAFCHANGICIKVFGMKSPEDIKRAIRGEVTGTTVTSD